MQILFIATHLLMAFTLLRALFVRRMLINMINHHAERQEIREVKDFYYGFTRSLLQLNAWTDFTKLRNNKEFKLWQLKNL